MSRRALRPRGDICQLCDFLLVRQPQLKKSIRPQRFLLTSARTFSTGRRLHDAASPIGSAGRSPVSKDTSNHSRVVKEERIPGKHATEAELRTALRQVTATCNKLLSLDRVPTEQETHQALSQCEAMAKMLVLEPPSTTGDKKHGATSALLSLDESSSKRKPPYKVTPAIQSMIDELSQITYSIIKFPPLFITPTALAMYVTIQATLGAPETLPEILNLYANKPVAQEGKHPIRYSKPSPNKVTNAIPQPVALSALQAAIDAKLLVPAMDIIQACYTTTAYNRAKFVRKGLLPATTLLVAPVAVYSVASQLALMQTTMDTVMATKVAFAGICAYLGFTSIVGVVAVTTANDQMVRVTWAPGVPLRERWMREEERAAIDKVAVAWGFREVWRRGEEEGEDWDLLREWIGGKAMMLDRVELMEGME
jgi:hypothetical protein